MANIIDGIQEELRRNRELLELYKSIPTGVFGASIIQRRIDEGEASIASGDIVRMVRAYKELESSSE